MTIETIALSVVILIPSTLACALAYLFARHVTQESERMMEVTKAAMNAVVAKSAKDVAEAKAVEDYQAEAIRQNREAFDNQQEEEEAPGPRRESVSDSSGGSWEIEVDGDKERLILPDGRRLEILT